MRRGWRGALYVLVAVCSVLAVKEAWSTRPPRADELTIRVWKARREMWLLQDQAVVRRFHIALGKHPTAGKLLRGDGRTPEGKYYVCEKRPQSRFRRFLAISYPNVDDAEKAYARRLISADEWADIFFANLHQQVPPWSTLMGGDVGIHGYGGRPQRPVDWTLGCIAVSDADIDYLYDVVPIGTPVVISD
jgi:murein L,D-transpeptidase YafK